MKHIKKYPQLLVENEINDTFDTIEKAINKKQKVKRTFKAAKRVKLDAKGLKTLDAIQKHLKKDLKDFIVTGLSKGDNYPSQESFRIITKDRKYYDVSMDVEDPGNFDISYSMLNEAAKVPSQFSNQEQEDVAMIKAKWSNAVLAQDVKGMKKYIKELVKANDAYIKKIESEKK